MRSHASPWFPLLGVVLVALVLFATGTALAQRRGVPPRQPVRPEVPTAPKRIVVERFVGPQASRVRAGLLADLSEHADSLTLVSDRDLRTAAGQMGVSRVRSEADYAAVAQQLGVAGFIEGRVVRRGRSWALLVRVRSGADGGVLGSETWSGGTMNALGAVRRNGYTRLAQYLDAARAPGPVAPPEPAETPWYQRVAVEPTEPVVHDDESEAPAGDNRYTVFRVGLGGGTLHRSMSAEVIPLYGPTGSETEGSPERRFYPSTGPLGHGEFGIEGEFFPGAIGSQAFPYLGLVFSYRHSAGLHIEGDLSGCAVDPCPVVAVSPSQFDLYFGARGRYAVGGPARGAELAFDLGFGYFGLSFDLDKLAQLEPSVIIPPVGYSYLHFGAGVSYPVVPTYLTLGVRLAYRLSLGVSAAQKEVWGTETSSAPGFLLGLDVKSAMPYLVRGLYVAFTLQYFSFSTTYQGDTACKTSACTLWSATSAGTPWQPIRVPDSVSDNYLRLALSVGYEFR